MTESHTGEVIDGSETDTDANSDSLAHELLLSTLRGFQAVWKLIYWNLLAIAARIVAMLWVMVAYIIGIVSYQVTPTAGYIAGVLSFLLLPILYGFVQRKRDGTA